MKVAMFTNNYFPRVSGVAVAVDFVDRSLKEHQCVTRIIAPDYGIEWDNPHGTKVHRIKSIPLKKHVAAFSLTSLDSSRILGVIEGFEPDIIHSNHPFLLGDLARKAADQFDIPLIYTFHTLYDFFSHYVGLNGELFKKIIRDYVVKYANTCDCVITPTEPIGVYLQRLGVTSPVKVVPTGIDFNRFKVSSEVSKESLKRKYKLDTFNTILLSVGRISEEKNVFLSVDTVYELKKRGCNCALMFFGKGPSEKSLQEYSHKLGVGDRVIFGGFLDQAGISSIYNLGDVFLFPSCSDTQGIVLYEALAAGIPIAAVDSMAAIACIDRRSRGLLTEENPKALAAAVEAIISDPAEFVPDFDPNEYSTHHIGALYEEIYQHYKVVGRSKVKSQESVRLREMDSRKHYKRPQQKKTVNRKRRKV